MAVVVVTTIAMCIEFEAQRPDCCCGFSVLSGTTSAQILGKALSSSRRLIKQCAALAVRP